MTVFSFDLNAIHGVRLVGGIPIADSPITDFVGSEDEAIAEAEKISGLHHSPVEIWIHSLGSLVFLATVANYVHAEI